METLKSQLEKKLAGVDLPRISPNLIEEERNRLQAVLSMLDDAYTELRKKTPLLDFRQRGILCDKIMTVELAIRNVLDPKDAA